MTPQLTRVYSFNPSSGLKALVFLRESIGALPLADCSDPSVADTLVSAMENIVKAATYLQHRRWFDHGLSEADMAKWIVEQTLLDIARTVHENVKEARMQVMSASQIKAQCERAAARLTEWMLSARENPGLVQPEKHVWTDRRGQSHECWRRHPNQLKGLHAVGIDGEAMDPVGAEGRSNAPINPENAADWFGVAFDVATFEEAGGRMEEEEGGNAANMSNAEITALGKAQLQQLKHAVVKDLIRKRTVRYGTLTSIGKPGETVGSSLIRSVDILLEIVDVLEIQPGDEAEAELAGHGLADEAVGSTHMETG